MFFTERTLRSSKRSHLSVRAQSGRQNMAEEAKDSKMPRSRSMVTAAHGNKGRILEGRSRSESGRAEKQRVLTEQGEISLRAMKEQLRADLPKEKEKSEKKYSSQV